MSWAKLLRESAPKQSQAAKTQVAQCGGALRKSGAAIPLKDECHAVLREGVINVCAEQVDLSGQCTSRPRGLRNPRNECFANAVAQALSSVPQLCFLATMVANTDAEWLKQSNASLAHLCNVVKYLNQGAGTPSVCQELRVLRRLFARAASEQQHDAHEFCNWLLDQVHQESKFGDNSTNHSGDNSDTSSQWRAASARGDTVLRQGVKLTPSLTSCLFAGVQRSCVSRPGRTTASPQSFFSLTLHLQPILQETASASAEEHAQSSVQALLQRHFRKSKVSDQRGVSVYSDMTHLPPCLLLHISRAGLEHKCMTNVVPDDTIVFRKRWLSGLQVQRYQLCAVVLHHGIQLESGHYTTVCRRGTQWFHVDDARVAACAHPQEYARWYRDTYLLVYLRANTD
ncbi:MAG: hypothetical protein MHM6MM_001675 [Cercozoa sp. M6MM]